MRSKAWGRGHGECRAHKGCRARVGEGQGSWECEIKSRCLTVKALQALSLLPQPLQVPLFPKHALHSTHPQPKPLSFAVPSKSAFPPLPLLTYERRGNSSASFTGILSPARCHYSAPPLLPILGLSYQVFTYPRRSFPTFRPL